MTGRSIVAGVISALATWAALAGPAVADDGTKAELDTMKRRIEAQDRRIRELEGKSPTQDEVAAAVDHYLSGSASPILVGGADAPGGKAGWPKGGAPFIQEGDNKISIHVRNQVRYEGFHYSKDAVGVLSSPANTFSDSAPRDRTGFEIERLFLKVDGQVFCPDITFNVTLNFDADQVAGVEKEYAWLDWKYAGEHHVRAGVDKVPFTYEEQNSSGATAFVDRCMFTKAFALDSDTGVMLWGYFGSCECPKQFLYRAMASTGEGPLHAAGSVFNTDAFDTYSDQLLFSGQFEWNITCKDWKYDEVDSRPCEERCHLDASVGIDAYYEDDNDVSEKSAGLALRSTGPLTRSAEGAWFRARWEGFSLEVEAARRNVDYTAGSAAPTQTDYGAEATLHYRFAESNWGVGVKYGMIWLDHDYRTITVGNNAPRGIHDTISELGVVLNYFFWDHANKLSADVTWVQDNSAVSSSSAGYLFSPAKGVVVEDGIMFRLQWQLDF